MERMSTLGSEYGRRMYTIADDFARKCAEIIHLAEITDERKPERKRAHTVTRVWSVWSDSGKKFYKSFLHYVPELGYYGVVKDMRGNLLFSTDNYCLASTVRMRLSEFIFSLGRRTQDETV